LTLSKVHFNKFLWAFGLGPMPGEIKRSKLSYMAKSGDG